MKFHWGHGISIFVVAFMTMILYFLISSFSHTTDLVATDYYQQEVNYQEQINKEKNARHLKIDMIIKSEGLHIQFPEAIDEGVIQFFRPSDQQLDFDKPLKLTSEHLQLVDLQDITSGLWRIKLEWKQAGKAHFYEQSIVVP